MLPSSQPRVFISYARSDGGRYATWLREKLQKEHPGITLWQDIVSQRSGRDWWLQITEALDHVEYMVLVATPNALQSDVVRKEWRYARQKGVCVLPVAASKDLDFDSLPRWMKTPHFADLRVKTQWQVFAADLERECQTPRVPFMAADLPEDFVARPEEFEPIVRLLLGQQRAQRKPVGITTALRGAGGFGKTTLAKAVCHDERVQEVFDDGVLWVTLGEKVENLTGKVADLTSVLSGEAGSFGDLDPAVTRLRELLAERDILLVIDDVWDPSHLEPFLQGGPYCARLITTRNLDTLPEKCSDVKVDSMQSSEAAELLGAGLSTECRSDIIALAERVGNWPLLLGIVKGVLQERVKTANQSPRDAIAYVNKALDKRGLAAFDPKISQARNRAVSLTVDVGLEQFSRDASERQRFAELSIFPEDIDIPLSVIATLWKATGGLDEFDTEDLCGRLHRYSLMQTLNLEMGHIRLHDVMLRYLQTALVRHTEAELVYGKLLGAWSDLRNLPDSRARHWCADHFIEIRLVEGAMHLSLSVIQTDPCQFASQMVGRLLPYCDIPAIAQFSKQVAEAASEPWLRELRPALNPPGTALIRTPYGQRIHAVHL